MSSKYKIRDHDKLYFLTFTTCNWIDIFTRPLYKDVLVDSLRFCQEKKGLELFAWVIMTNHIHLIARAEPSVLLHDIVRDFKKYTSVTLCRMIESNQQESRKEWMLWMLARAAQKTSKHQKYLLWQEGYHPVELSSNQIMEQKLDYLHQNPVKEGWVDTAEEYVYSSARVYAGRKGLLEIKMIE